MLLLGSIWALSGDMWDLKAGERKDHEATNLSQSTTVKWAQYQRYSDSISLAGAWRKDERNNYRRGIRRGKYITVITDSAISRDVRQ